MTLYEAQRGGGVAVGVKSLFDFALSCASTMMQVAVVSLNNFARAHSRERMGKDEYPGREEGRGERRAVDACCFSHYLQHCYQHEGCLTPKQLQVIFSAIFPYSCCTLVLLLY